MRIFYLGGLALLLVGFCLPLMGQRTESRAEKRAEKQARRQAKRLAHRDYLTFSFHGVGTTVQDPFLSQHRYGGLGGGLGVGYWNFRPRGLEIVDFAQFSVAGLSPGGPGSSGQQIITRGGYAYLRQGGSLAGGTWYLGGFVDGHAFVRTVSALANSSYNAENGGSLGPIAYWERPLKLWRWQPRLSTQLSLPLVAVYLREPYYGVDFDGGRIFASPPWGYLDARAETALWLPLGQSRTNFVRLTYGWTYHTVKPRPAWDRLHQVVHQFELAFCMALD